MNCISQIVRTAAGLALCTGFAHAAPSELIIDPAQSSFNIDITLVIGTSVVSSDSSPLSGTIEIDLDDPTTPAIITLHDFDIQIDEILNFNWSFGFLGSADATMTSPSGTGAGNLFLDPLSPPIPAPLVADAFVFSQVPTRLNGLVDANYNILFVGSNSVIVDLSTLTTAASDMPGSIVLAGDQLTTTTSFVFSGEQPLVDDTGATIGTILFDGDAFVVATGTFNSCSADVTGNGSLDIFDVFAFLDLFNASDLAADFTGDGTLDIFDFFAFLDAFNAGCPA